MSKITTQLVVMKFGGTSVSSTNLLCLLPDLFKENEDNRLLLVMSALSGVTNLLEDLHVDLVNGKDQAFKHYRGKLEALHLQFLDRVVGKETTPQIWEQCSHLLVEFEIDLLKSASTLSGPAFHALVLSIGERLSTAIYTALLAPHNDLVPADARQLMITNDDHTHAEPLDQVCEQRWLDFLRDQPSRIILTQGFIGATQNGETTTLGRGGSDYTATYLAALLKAREVVIWTDVNGVLTVDPRLDETAQTIQKLTYNEAAALSYFGVRVLNPRCIEPLKCSGVPLVVCNTFAPHDPCTEINDEPFNGHPHIFALSCKQLKLHLSLKAESSLCGNTVHVLVPRLDSEHIPSLNDVVLVENRKYDSAARRRIHQDLTRHVQEDEAGPKTFGLIYIMHKGLHKDLSLQLAMAAFIEEQDLPVLFRSPEQTTHYKLLVVPDPLRHHVLRRLHSFLGSYLKEYGRTDQLTLMTGPESTRPNISTQQKGVIP